MARMLVAPGRHPIESQATGDKVLRIEAPLQYPVASESRDDASSPPAKRSECLVVLNDVAGTKKSDPDTASKIETGLQEQGIHPEIRTSNSGSDIEPLVFDALSRNVRVIVAGGGDGTVSTIAGQLLESDTVLGVIPLGTLNHFARDLAIPLDLDAAVAVLAGGRETLVDVGEVNGHTFINNSSIGLYPLAVRMREENQKRGAGKWFAFAKAIVAVFGRYPLMYVRMTVDGRDLTLRTPIVFVGNNHYELEGLEMSKRQRLDEGILSICVTRSVGRFGLLGLMVRALFGRLRNARDFSVYEGQTLTIETHRRKVRVATDGEVSTMTSPLQYRSRAKALRVIVPATNDTSEDRI